MHESDSTLQVKEKALEPHKRGGGGVRKKLYGECSYHIKTLLVEITRQLHILNPMSTCILHEILMNFCSGSRMTNMITCRCVCVCRK